MWRFTAVLLSLFFVSVISASKDSRTEWRYSQHMRHLRQLSGHSMNYAESGTVATAARPSGNRKPVFKGCSNYNGKVREETPPGTEVLQVTAIDPDPPEAGGSITYTFVTAPGERPKFNIDSKIGKITTRAVFDRDEPSREKEMFVTVRATDNGRPQLDDVCTIRVIIQDHNDNKPVFDKVSYIESVPEDARPGLEVMRVSATDIDDGNNSVVMYSLLAKLHEDRGYFLVQPTTGAVYVGRDIDRAPGYKFVLEAIASDLGDTPLSTKIDIQVTVVEGHKRVPFFTQIPEGPIVLSESYNDFRTPVATLTAVSNIVEPDLSFTVTSQSSAFMLEAEGGVAKLFLARQLDFEAAPEHNITVRVQNKYNLGAENVVRILVQDENDNIPVFAQVSTGMVLEHELPGAPVMQVRAVDADGTTQHNQVTYELGDSEDLFSIDPRTGVITTRQIFDREERDFYSVKVVATDSSPSALLTSGQHNRGQQVFHIEIGDINDNPPHFSRKIYKAEAAEDANVHSLVTEIRAIDSDTGSESTYKLESGNTGDAFLIEPSTGKIRVNKPLDYETITNYTLLVRAYDGIYEDYATVEISVQNVNDNRPVFLTSDRNVTIVEEQLINECIVKLAAYDPDVTRRDDDQHIRFLLVKEEQQQIFHIDHDGCLYLRKPLDRDAPRGFPVWQVLVSARDEDGGPASLSESAEVLINLIDVNDNPPNLSNDQPVIWLENQPPGVITALFATDPDDDHNGAPFHYALHPQAGDDIRSAFQLTTDASGTSQLEALVTFDREHRKEYTIPLLIWDSGVPTMSGNATLNVIIGDVNDNPMKPATSQIIVLNYKGLAGSVIGRVYVEDPDDWDLADKQFAWLGGVSHPYFRLETGTGEIRALTDPPSDTHLLEFMVVEDSANVSRHAVGATVSVIIHEVSEEAIKSSASIRLANITAHKFVETQQGQTQSGLASLQEKLSQLLNVSDVHVISAVQVAPEFLDLRFTVLNAPLIPPEAVIGVLAQHIPELERVTGAQVWMIPVDACLEEGTMCDGSCVNQLEIHDKPLMVFTNTSSFAGVHVTSIASCKCQTDTSPQYYCLNGGTPKEMQGCECSPGYDGPHCEMLNVGFSGDGWAWYPHLSSCHTSSLSLDIQTDNKDGLLIYMGPLTSQTGLKVKDFLSLELVEGHPRLLLDYGSGTSKLEQKYVNIADGHKHHIEVHWSATSIELKVSSCSTCLALTAPLGVNMTLNVNSPLQLGGTPLPLKTLSQELGWGHVPSQDGFTGCISNLTFNGKVMDLGAASASHRVMAGCTRTEAQVADLGLAPNFLVAVVACFAMLLGLLAVALASRGREKAVCHDDMEDVRENIVCYSDEGGGEGDMTAYDLSVLQLYQDQTKMYHCAPKAIPEEAPETIQIEEILNSDEMRVFAYEGDGDSRASLSSIVSTGTIDDDLNFRNFTDLDPRLRTLAEVYEVSSGEEEVI